MVVAVWGTTGTATVTFFMYRALVSTRLSSTASDIKLMPNPNKGTFTIKGTLGTLVDEEVSWRSQICSDKLFTPARL